MNNSPLSKVHVVRSAAQMFATEKHLNGMRAIAFHACNLTAP
jgi:hypothetical protein